MKFTKYAIGYSLLALAFPLSRQNELFILLAFWGGCFVVWAQFSPTPHALDGAKRVPDCKHGYNGICPVCDALQTPPRK